MPAPDLTDARFPLASRYDAEWLLEDCYAANPLWLAEWLCADLGLAPGMRVLDLGCGHAQSSVFLAREHDVEVWAVDLWSDPTDNWRRVRASGAADRVHPLQADARRLPFAEEFFDVIVSIDSFQYYGTDDLFLPDVLRLLRPNGRLGIASPGVVQEMAHPVPEHLEQFWGADNWCLHSADWWRAHWERTGLVDVSAAELLPEGWRLWHRWALAGQAADWYAEAIAEDAGRWLGYVRAVATKRVDAPSLPYDLHTGESLD